MPKVIENGNQLPESHSLVYIKPVQMNFCNQTGALGILVIDDKIKTYVCPIQTDFSKPPYHTVTCLMESMGVGSIVFLDIMKRAYEEKKDIVFIGLRDNEQIICYWYEYEMIFNKYPFYTEPVCANMIEMDLENENSHRKR